MFRCLFKSLILWIIHLQRTQLEEEEKAMDFDFPRVVVYLTSSFYSVTATVYSELSVSFCSGFSIYIKEKNPAKVEK